MAPEPLSDLLNAVSPGRRGFLKTVLTGTAFAAPLMASFPMDGLSVDAAVAACSNQAFAPNMSASVADFVTHPLTCLNTSNMTVQRAPMFKAKLKDSKNHQRGTVTFEVDVTRCVIEYRLNLTGKLATVNYHSVGVPAAETLSVQ